MIKLELWRSRGRVRSGDRRVVRRPIVHLTSEAHRCDPTRSVHTRAQPRTTFEVELEARQLQASDVA